jgi:uncharacterized protein (DUF1800 family)
MSRTKGLRHSLNGMHMDRSFAYFVLGRAGYGASVESVTQLQAIGLNAWLDEQLKVRPNPEPDLDRRLREARLRIKYPAGEGFAATDELRALSCLDAPIASLWHLVDHKNLMHVAERRRPRDEVVAATVLRAVHSRLQVREVLCGFWHDHFNVDANGEAIGVALPAYDRDVIRAHCLGNFREMLETVAKSAAMQYYLSNRSSRAGAANENFARELFELHTLGRSAYLNDRYDRWREVPGALQGHPSGYIDQDVYEAARAFTGWTIEDGSGVDARRKLPQTGQFVYVENWHDGYQKRVLGSEFEAFSPAMADGRQVLDLVAQHPATARFVCEKLCRRLLGDPVPQGLHQRLQQLWLEHVESHDQIARVVRALLTSKEFADPKIRGNKVRRPLSLAASFCRAMQIDVKYAEPLGNELSACGQNLFGWPTPTGLPDQAAPFLTSQAMRHRWSLLLSLAENNWSLGSVAPPDVLGLAGQPTSRTAVEVLSTALLGGADERTVAAVVAGCGWPADELVAAHGPAEAARRWARLSAFVAMAPAYQVS